MIGRLVTVFFIIGLGIGFIIGLLFFGEVVKAQPVKKCYNVNLTLERGWSEQNYKIKGEICER